MDSTEELPKMVVPQQTADQAVCDLERVRDLAIFALAADRTIRSDPAEWYRTVLRAVADIRDAARDTERALSDQAQADAVLTPTEIARAARLSTAALYKRKKKV
ncbi:hypothetical protein ACH427_32275 [Streptomyces sp. NPDC020379]|uniref:hypothetical protein n=1 Tax=Streptomyces sp. NPDC020379 TaxID=3365071 RepID=UPI0037B552F2